MYIISKFITFFIYRELDNNEINVIEKAGLFNLTSLKAISLSNNLITHVAVDGWEFCQKIEKLLVLLLFY